MPRECGCIIFKYTGHTVRTRGEEKPDFCLALDVRQEPLLEFGKGLYSTRSTALNSTRPARPDLSEKEEMLLFASTGDECLLPTPVPLTGTLSQRWGAEGGMEIGASLGGQKRRTAACSRGAFCALTPLQVFSLLCLSDTVPHHQAAVLGNLL